MRDLEPQCSKQILRVAELQADDYHLDRPLFYACREDRETFCPKTKAGNGKVFRCLYRHKFDREMSNEVSMTLSGEGGGGELWDFRVRGVLGKLPKFVSD